MKIYCNNISLFKKKLTEQEAASHFVLYIIKEAQDASPTIHKSLTDSFKEKFVVEDEKEIVPDLKLNKIGQDEFEIDKNHNFIIGSSFDDKEIISKLDLSRI